MYRTLKSLSDYLLIPQNQTLVERFSLGSEGRWMLSDYRTPDPHSTSE